MISVNKLKKINCNQKEILEPLIILLSPFAPFISEEIWNKLHPEKSVLNATFPEYNKSFLIRNEINYPIAINGKRKLNVIIKKDLINKDIEKIILSNEKIIQLTKNKTVQKIIIVKEKIINIVIKN